MGYIGVLYDDWATTDIHAHPNADSHPHNNTFTEQFSYTKTNFY
jgi:hypothetical protein